MSAELQEQFKTAYLELREEFGVGIVFGNVPEIQAIVAESEMSKQLVSGGQQDDAEFVAKVLLEDLPAIPEIDSAVTYQGVPYKVRVRAIQPGHPIGEFTIQTTNR